MKGVSRHLSSFLKILKIAEDVGLGINGGLVTINASAVIAAGVAEQDARILSGWVDSLNGAVSNGSLHLGEGAKGWQQIRAGSPIFFTATKVFDVTVADTEYKCDIDTHWYGTTITLNKAATTKLVQLIFAGVSTAGICSALAAMGVITAVTSPVFALIGACLGLGAGIINIADLCKGSHL